MTAGHPLPEIIPEFETAPATMEAGSSERERVVKVGGDWRVGAPTKRSTCVGARSAKPFGVKLFRIC